jgi:hypothetical protein
VAAVKVTIGIGLPARSVRFSSTTKADPVGPRSPYSRTTPFVEAILPPLPGAHRGAHRPHEALSLGSFGHTAYASHGRLPIGIGLMDWAL